MRSVSESYTLCLSVRCTLLTHKHTPHKHTHNPHRFTGSQAIDPRAAAAFQRTPTAAAQPQEAEQQLQKTLAADQELDRELAQCLQHLGKRDSTTRLKALQVGGCKADTACDSTECSRACLSMLPDPKTHKNTKTHTQSLQPTHSLSPTHAHTDFQRSCGLQASLRCDQHPPPLVLRVCKAEHGFQRRCGG